jgi:hypothetical protein
MWTLALAPCSAGRFVGERSCRLASKATPTKRAQISDREMNARPRPEPRTPDGRNGSACPIFRRRFQPWKTTNPYSLRVYAWAATSPAHWATYIHGARLWPNVQDEPRPWLARLVLLGARDVTAMVVGSGALLGRFALMTLANPIAL